MESSLASFLGLGLPILGAALVAIIAYWKDQQLKRMEQHHKTEEELRRHKQRLYSKLQLSIFNLWASKGIAAREVEALCNISDGWIFASDEVLRQINIFMQTYDDSRRKRESFANRSERLQPIVAELFLRIRQDLFATQLNLSEARSSVKFYRWVGKPSESS
jgi:hypothetical protein